VIALVILDDCGVDGHGGPSGVSGTEQGGRGQKQRCRRQAETRTLGLGIRRRRRRVRDGPGLRHAGRLRFGQHHRVRLRPGRRLRASGRALALSHARPHGHDDHEERAGAATVPGDGREARPVPGGRPVSRRGTQAVSGGRAQTVSGGRRETVPGARGQAVPGARAPAVRRARGQARWRPGAATVSRRGTQTVLRPAAAAVPQAALLRPRLVVNGAPGFLQRTLVHNQYKYCVGMFQT